MGLGALGTGLLGYRARQEGGNMLLRGRAVDMSGPTLCLQSGWHRLQTAGVALFALL